MYTSLNAYYIHIPIVLIVQYTLICFCIAGFNPTRHPKTPWTKGLNFRFRPWELSPPGNGPDLVPGLPATSKQARCGRIRPYRQTLSFFFVPSYPQWRIECSLHLIDHYATYHFHRYKTHNDCKSSTTLQLQTYTRVNGSWIVQYLWIHERVDYTRTGLLRCMKST